MAKKRTDLAVALGEGAPTKGPAASQPRTLRQRALDRGVDPAGFTREKWVGGLPVEFASGLRQPDIDLSTQAGAPITDGTKAQPFASEQAAREDKTALGARFKNVEASRPDPGASDQLSPFGDMIDKKR